MEIENGRRVRKGSEFLTQGTHPNNYDPSGSLETLLGGYKKISEWNATWENLTK